MHINGFQWYLTWSLYFNFKGNKKLKWKLFTLRQYAKILLTFSHYFIENYLELGNYWHDNDKTIADHNQWLPLYKNYKFAIVVRKSCLHGGASFVRPDVSATRRFCASTFVRIDVSAIDVSATTTLVRHLFKSTLVQHPVFMFFRFFFLSFFLSFLLHVRITHLSTF